MQIWIFALEYVFRYIFMIMWWFQLVNGTLSPIKWRNFLFQVSSHCLSGYDQWIWFISSLYSSSANIRSKQRYWAANVCPWSGDVLLMVERQYFSLFSVKLRITSLHCLFKFISYCSVWWLLTHYAVVSVCWGSDTPRIVNQQRRDCFLRYCCKQEMCEQKSVLTSKQKCYHKLLIVVLSLTAQFAQT